MAAGAQNDTRAGSVTSGSRLATTRVLAAAAAGGVAALVVALDRASWSVAALVGWDVAAVVFLVWVWVPIWHADADATAQRAREEDSRTAAEAILVSAGVASLVAVAFTLVQAAHSTPSDRGLLTALGVVSVILGWTSVHTVYLLRYARIYFSAPTGGIDFRGEPPQYLDFAYLAFTIGMTFQVSDTDLTTKRMRRVAIHHSLISYLFGTVIVAITINIVAGLLGR